MATVARKKLPFEAETSSRTGLNGGRSSAATGWVKERETEIEREIETQTQTQRCSNNRKSTDNNKLHAVTIILI